MKGQAFLGDDYQFCSLIWLMLFFWSSLIIQEANSASIPNCELRPFCSSGCLKSTQKTVDPGSLATGGCSIMNGGSTRDMTWEQVRQMVHGNNNAHDLVSHQENPLCSCTRIIFTRPVHKVFKTSSPVWFHPNKEVYLSCTFKGWPRPHVLWFSPDGKEIIKEYDGFHISEEMVGEDTLRSVLSNPRSQEKHEGDYRCTAKNSIPGWSSESPPMVTELIYECPWPKHPSIFSSKVMAEAFSIVSLKCLVEIDPDACADSLKLEWRFRNSPAAIKNNEKYKIQEKKTNTKCKREFILTINDVNKDDAGKYSCHSLCAIGNTSADIELTVKDVVT